MECASPYCERPLSQATRHNVWQPYCGRYCEVFHRTGRTYDSRLTDTQIQIFEALKEEKSFSSRSHLARYLGKTRATINESITNMERYGWVVDASLENHSKTVKLSRKGKAYCKEGYPDHKRLPISAPCDGCATGVAIMEWRDPRKANQTFCSAKCYHHNVCGSARKGARNYTILKILRAKGPMTSKDIAYNLELFNTRGTSIRVANTLKNYTSKGAVFKEEYPSNKDSNVYFWTGNVEMHELFNPKS